MILAQSLQQLLSGSKYLGLVFLLAFSLTACSSTKSVNKQKKRTPTRSTQTKKKQKAKDIKVDTIKWSGVDTKSGSVLPGANGMIKKRNYNVAMFMPFKIKGSESSDISDKSSRVNGFLNYYAGVKFALKQLEKEDVNLRLQVYDSESSSLQTKLRRASKDSDLIIGPYSRNDIMKAANLGKENDLTIVSPWKATTKVKDNPYYVQLLPNLNDHFDKIIEHATSSYESENIVLVGRKGNSKDMNIIRYLQESNKIQNGSRADRLPEYYVEMDSLMNGEIAFDEVFVEGEKTVFVVPNYSSKDENYLHSCLRKINVEKGQNKVSVYTMPLAFTSDLITFDYYKNLDMKIVRSYYVDYSDKRVQQFRRDFFDVFNATPTDDAFKGYDMMLFVGRALYEYGTEFQFHMNSNDHNYLQTDFTISAKKEFNSDGEYDEINYFLNTHLDILEFKQNQFSRN